MSETTKRVILEALESSGQQFIDAKVELTIAAADMKLAERVLHATEEWATTLRKAG